MILCRWIVVLVLLLLSVAGGAVELPIKAVEIKVTPTDGMAFCRYTADGKLHGGHLSGGPAVRVYEADGQVKQPVIDQIWSLASDLRRRGIVTGPVIWDQNSRKHNHIVLQLQDGTELRASWPEAGQPSDKVARQLAELLFQYHVGGW